MSRSVDREALPMQSEMMINLIRESDPNALSLVAENQDGYYVAKRILDFSLALVLLVLLLPLMLLVALIIVL